MILSQLAKNNVLVSLVKKVTLVGFEPTLLKFGISFNRNDEMIRLNRSATVSCLLVCILEKEIRAFQGKILFFVKY